jgi:hypothetical protein
MNSISGAGTACASGVAPPVNVAATMTAASHIPRFIDVPYLCMCCERIGVNMEHQVFRLR